MTWPPRNTPDHAQIQKGAWGPDPPENHKTIGFLSSNGSDPLKNHKATKSATIDPLSDVI